LAEFGIDDRRGVGLHGFLRIENVRKFLVDDIDSGDRFLGDLRGFGGHRGYSFAGPNGLVQGEDAGSPRMDLFRTILSSDDGPNPRESFRLRGVELHDPGVGIGAAQGPDRKQAGEVAAEIGGEPGPPQHLIQGVHPRDALPDHFERGAGRFA
jgi:hypothetical protein